MIRPATEPRPASDVRVLVLERDGARVAPAAALPDLLAPGDLVVVNDAATLPASVAARAGDEPVEVRLLAAPDRDLVAPAALLGAGDFRTPTEHRPAPPVLAPGATLRAGRLRLEVVGAAALSPRLVTLRLALADAAGPSAIWAELYRVGRPVQYAYVPRPLALWDVQNVYAGAPWAVEMPSAGRALTSIALARLRANGVSVARVTHAAGLSSTGDPAIDAALPLPERFRVPAETAAAVAAARARGGRVLAVGTSVVRALEAAARAGGGAVTAAEGTTDLRLGPGEPLLATDGLLTGVHEAGTSHFDLLGAFAPRAALDHALARSAEEGLFAHELGDAWLVWRPRSARFAA